MARMGGSFRFGTGAPVAVLVSMLAGPGAAHEVRPAVMDVILADRVRAEVSLNAEAILAGIDLSVYGDTNEAPQGAEYDRLRALPADALAAAVWENWPQIAEGFVLEGAGAPDLLNVVVGKEGNIELPRDTVVLFEAELDADAVAIGWVPAYGELILRQDGVEDGYAAMLPIGGVSPPLEAARPGFFARIGFWLAGLLD